MRSAGAELQALRKREPKTCPICGRAFVGLTRQLYDSKLCGNKAAYRRNGRADRRRPARQQEDGASE